jgi:hypothetical protein
MPEKRSASNIAERAKLTTIGWYPTLNRFASGVASTFEETIFPV